MICERKLKAHDAVTAESEVAMTTMISSRVKDENHIFTGYIIFITGKILVFHWCPYNKKLLTLW